MSRPFSCRSDSSASPVDADPHVSSSNLPGLAVASARFERLDRRSACRRRMSVCLSLCVALSAWANAALADDRERLAPGLYVAATVGCGGLGGAGTVDFDGKNFSPHYQACLTQALAQNARYRQTCVEGQGQNYPTTAEIQGDPSRTTKDVIIAVLSEKSFTMNGARYDYCGAR
jgi:hypothetical protein